MDRIETEDDQAITIKNDSAEARTYTGGLFGYTKPTADAARSFASALGASAEDAERMASGEVPQGTLRMRDGTRFVATHFGVSAATARAQPAEDENARAVAETSDVEDEDEPAIEDRELIAIEMGITYLEPLDYAAAGRVLAYLAARFGPKR